jgi:hypothetical protein
VRNAIAKETNGNMDYDVTKINEVTFAGKPLQSKSLRLKNVTLSDNSIAQTATNVKGNTDIHNGILFK